MPSSAASASVVTLSVTLAVTGGELTPTATPLGKNSGWAASASRPPSVPGSTTRAEERGRAVRDRNREAGRVLPRVRDTDHARRGPRAGAVGAGGADRRPGGVAGGAQGPEGREPAAVLRSCEQNAQVGQLPGHGSNQAGDR